MNNQTNYSKRGFELSEYQNRTLQLQNKMLQENIDVAFFSTEPEFKYYSGFQTQFWQSPTRPWFLVIPSQGKPIAVVPEIGVTGFNNTWIDDIRSWPSPQPEDDGISLMADTLKSFSKTHSKIGCMLGAETYMRMPVNNFKQLQSLLSRCHFTDISLMMRNIRAIKSASEVEKIKVACSITSNGFDYLSSILEVGMTERKACQLMQIEMLRLGADLSPYLIAAAGQQGYENIIMGPSDRMLKKGDIFTIDTGTMFDGYFSDFNRNYSIGKAGSACLNAYQILFEAIQQGLSLAKPGNPFAQIWESMWKVIEPISVPGNSVGRMGHGIGMQLTEFPSVTQTSTVLLEEGMVITLEPSVIYAPNKIMTLEENILITNGGCKLLSKRAPSHLPIIH